jgi:hypothetical protein
MVEENATNINEMIFQSSLFKAIAEKMKFRYQLVPPTDGGKWGSMLAPGNPLY